MIKLFKIVCAMALAMVGLSVVAEPKGPEYAVVTSAGDGLGLGGGKITLRDAIAAMAAAPDWVGADGRRAITFSSAVTNISLQSPLTVPHSTRPFLIDGGPDGKVLTADGTSRILALENEGDFTGEPCFGADGQPNPAAEPLPFSSPLTLYAKWTATPTLLTVTTGGDEHVEGRVTLREAVDVLTKYDFADRTIRFDGVAEIRLKEQIVVPEGTRPSPLTAGRGVWPSGQIQTHRPVAA